MDHRPVPASDRPSELRRRLTTPGLSFGIVLIGLAVATVIEPISLRVQDYSAVLPGWPAHLNAIRIAIPADLHTGFPFNAPDNLRKIVETTNANQRASGRIGEDLDIVVGAARCLCGTGQS